MKKSCCPGCCLKANNKRHCKDQGTIETVPASFYSPFVLIDTFCDDVNSPETFPLPLSFTSDVTLLVLRGDSPEYYIPSFYRTARRKKNASKVSRPYCTRIAVFESSKGRPSSATCMHAPFFSPPALLADGEEPVGRIPTDEKQLCCCPGDPGFLISFCLICLLFSRFFWRKPKSKPPVIDSRLAAGRTPPITAIIGGGGPEKKYYRISWKF